MKLYTDLLACKFFVKITFTAFFSRLFLKAKKKLSKMKNENYVHHAPYLRNSVAYNYDFWYTCVKWWYLQAFFIFLKNLIYWVVSGVKGQNMAQNDKKLCLLCLISQEPCIIWSSFMVHICKKIISPGVFYIFHTLYLKDCGSYHQDFCYAGVKFVPRYITTHISMPGDCKFFCLMCRCWYI